MSTEFDVHSKFDHTSIDLLGTQVLLQTPDPIDINYENNFLFAGNDCAAESVIIVATELLARGTHAASKLIILRKKEINIPVDISDMDSL